MQKCCTQDCFDVYSCFVMMALLACCMLICMAQYWQQQPPYAHFCPTWSPFLYFKWQRCRTSLLIFSFFILSPSLLCVCISFPTSRCLYYVFWDYFLFCIHIRRMDSTPFQHVSTWSSLQCFISLQVATNHWTIFLL